jgi:hypothetical protein
VLSELIVRAFCKLKSKEPVLHPTERYLNSQLTVGGFCGFYWLFEVISR